MKIKAIGFDYGGVIAKNSGQPFDQRVSRALGMSMEEYRKEYFKVNHLPNSGKMSWDEFWVMFTNKLGKQKKLEGVRKVVHELNTRDVDESVLSLVQKLKENKYKVGLLSNTTLDAVIRFRSLGFYELFDTVVVSAEVGYSKPDPKVFELFIDNLDVKAEELVFIDDSINSLKTANEIGYHPILFTAYEKLLEELKILNINFS